MKFNSGRKNGFLPTSFDQRRLCCTRSMPCLTTQGSSSSQETSKKPGEKETGSSASNCSLPDPLATALLKLLATVLQCFATASPEEKEKATLVQRMVDLIG